MSARRNILMLTTQLGYGGAETSFIRLANFLAQSMDVTVALFTTDYGPGAYSSGHEPLNAKVVLLDGAPTNRLNRWFRRIRGLHQLKATHDASISFLSGPNLVNVLAGHNHRTIVSLRGSRFYDPVAPRFQQWLFQWLLDPIIFHLAARIVPVSAGLQNEIRAVAGKKTLKKVRVISPFIETATLVARLADPAPEPYASLQGQKIIAAAGRLSIEKGFHHLIRVFARVTQTQPDAKLLLIGDGPMLQQLRDLCAELHLSMDDTTPGTASVIFAGYQKNILPLLKLSRVYAMTSATEGFPNVVLEAMATGLPIIAADTPWGARAILDDTATPARDPYPTTQPTTAKYGTLMPRIDQSHHHVAWATALSEALQSANSPTHDRATHFDKQHIGEQWKHCIEELAK